MKTSILFGHSFKERAYLPNELPDPTRPYSTPRWLKPYIHPAERFRARIRLGSWEFPVFGGVASSVKKRAVMGLTGKEKLVTIEAAVLRPEDVAQLDLLDQEIEAITIARRALMLEAGKRGRPVTIEDCVNAAEAQEAKR